MFSVSRDETKNIKYLKRYTLVIELSSTLYMGLNERMSTE